jgi:hypothetical protein
MMIIEQKIICEPQFQPLLVLFRPVLRNQAEPIRTVGLAGAAVNCPVVVAVFVRAAFAIVEQSILTLLQRDRAVRAFKEVVTEVRVSVRLDTEWLWAGRNV